MKIAWLTTSRADFGICIPMILKLKSNPKIELDIIATGSHLMVEHGNTVDDIFPLGVNVHQVPVHLNGSDAASVAHAYANTGLAFSKFWEDHHQYDLIFALGDRYEMAAALLAAVPFRIPIAHLCGGDITDGAIDQMYRDIITMIAKFHFTTEERSAARVSQLKANYADQVIANVGSLAIEQLQQHTDIDEVTFKNRWGIDIHKPFFLVTFHPETMHVETNEHHVRHFQSFWLRALNESEEQWLITLPNADAEAEIWRKMLLSVAEEFPSRVKCHSHLGVQGYYTAMRNCVAMIGNTSSGIVESATLGAWVLNVGDRQKGRSRNPNVNDMKFDESEIWRHWKEISSDRYQGGNLYGDGLTSKKIMDLLSQNFISLHEL